MAKARERERGRMLKAPPLIYRELYISAFKYNPDKGALKKGRKCPTKKNVENMFENDIVPIFVLKLENG